MGGQRRLGAKCRTEFRTRFGETPLEWKEGVSRIVRVVRLRDVAIELRQPRRGRKQSAAKLDADSAFHTNLAPKRDKPHRGLSNRKVTAGASTWVMLSSLTLEDPREENGNGRNGD